LSDLTCTAPSLQPDYRALITTTSRPAPVPRGTLPLAVSAAWGPPSRGQPAGQLPGPATRRCRGDRFSCSMPAPATSSRHLYTGHRQGHTQAASWLRTHPPGAPLSPERVPVRVLMPISCLSMRQQWFTHVRLLVTHLTRSRRAFSGTLTTTALYRRSSRWFGLPACTANPEGHILHHWHSTVRAGDLLHHHHSPFKDTRTPDIGRSGLSR
jgi:hypothetical protein